MKKLFKTEGQAFSFFLSLCTHQKSPDLFLLETYKPCDFFFSTPAIFAYVIFLMDVTIYGKFYPIQEENLMVNMSVDNVDA